jgi:hypothetical protein
MEKETKKYLLIGGALIISVSIGVLLWKKYQSSSSSSQAATDQSNQDELALEAAALANNAYAGQAGGAQPFSVATVGGAVPQTLAQEITAIEEALGIAPPATGTTTTTTTPATPTTPAENASPATATAPLTGGGSTVKSSGAPIFETAYQEPVTYLHNSVEDKEGLTIS